MSEWDRLRDRTRSRSLPARPHHAPRDSGHARRIAQGRRVREAEEKGRILTFTSYPTRIMSPLYKVKLSWGVQVSAMNQQEAHEKVVRMLKEAPEGVITGIESATAAKPKSI